MFRSADLVLVNKVGLLEHLDVDLEQFLGNLDAVNRVPRGVARDLAAPKDRGSDYVRGTKLLEGVPPSGDSGLPLEERLC